MMPGLIVLMFGLVVLGLGYGAVQKAEHPWLAIAGMIILIGGLTLTGFALVVIVWPGFANAIPY